MARAQRVSRAKLAARIAEQRQWIAEHGGSLAGYIERYGSAADPKHYGDGGEAIYEADTGALRKLLAQANPRKRTAAR